MRVDIEINDITNPDVDWIVAQGIIRDVIAGLIIKLINADESGVYNVGTERKSMLQLAKQTKDELYFDYVPNGLPKNTSFSIEKLNKFLK